MRVWFGGKRESRDPLYGLPLTPGENKVDDDRGRLLVASGIVDEVESAAVSRERRR